MSVLKILTLCEFVFLINLKASRFSYCGIDFFDRFDRKITEEKIKFVRMSCETWGYKTIFIMF